MPTSDKKLTADSIRQRNRANAQHSTGPRTPEGKARSAQNARRHGFRASTFAVVRLEELDEIDNLRTDLIALYEPINSQELFAIERIALAQQSLLRSARFEAGLFTTCLNEALDPLGQEINPMTDELIKDVQIVREQNRNYILAEGFHRMAKTANTWSLFLRYQAQAERLYRRAIEEFERLKALRPELPNEPNVDVETPQPVDVSEAPEPQSLGDTSRVRAQIDADRPGMTEGEMSLQEISIVDV
jgi:hypothetical protein